MFADNWRAVEVIQAPSGIGSMNDWSCHCILFPCIILVPVVMCTVWFPIVTFNGPFEYTFRQCQYFGDPDVIQVIIFLTMSNPVEQVYSRRCTIATSLPRPVTNRFCNNLCSESDRNGETAEVLSWVATTIQLPWSPNSTSTNQWSLNCLRCFHGFSQTISTTSLSSKDIFRIPQSRAPGSLYNTSPYFQSFRLAWFSQGCHAVDEIMS